MPGAGAVLVPMNTRLTGADYAYMLEHSGARALFAYRGLAEVADEALAQLGDTVPQVIWVDDDYEQLLDAATPQLLGPVDVERGLLSLNYTSGTTGKPKGVMTCHRGAYLHTLGVIAEAGLSPRSTYLWTLPMFHCNGWAYTWAVTAAGAGTSACPGWEPAEIWRAIAEFGVTHMCAAPTVVSMMLGSDAAAVCPEPVRLFCGGSPPAPALLDEAKSLGIDITHLYGLTETYGPLAVCAWDPAWDMLSRDKQARLRPGKASTRS